MEAVVLVLNVIPAQQQPAALQRMFSPLVQPLHQLLATQPQPQSADQREAILTLMDRLGVLFRFGQVLDAKLVEAWSTTSTNTVCNTGYCSAVNRCACSPCRHVQQPAAVVEVFAGVWPMFQAALGLYGREPRPSERLCKVSQSRCIDVLKNGQSLLQFC